MLMTSMAKVVNDNIEGSLYVDDFHSILLLRHSVTNIEYIVMHKAVLF